MMVCSMWLMRVILVFGLVAQLLWARGGLAPSPPCPHRQPAIGAGPRPADEGGRRCCRPASDGPARRGCCGGRPAKTEKTPSRDASGDCDVTNCCQHRVPRPPRPVDRIAPPQKRPDAALSVAIQSPSMTMTPPAPARPWMRAVPIASHRNRLASLCVWRN
ncbi:MAG: hypothetical protein SYC29_11495 [Planctomycetota bacterium]|nr:hypothetical protein [Planctomycetota bacterium]